MHLPTHTHFCYNIVILYSLSFAFTCILLLLKKYRLVTWSLNIFVKLTVGHSNHTKLTLLTQNIPPLANSFFHRCLSWKNNSQLPVTFILFNNTQVHVNTLQLKTISCKIQKDSSMHNRGWEDKTLSHVHDNHTIEATPTEINMVSTVTVIASMGEPFQELTTPAQIPNFANNEIRGGAHAGNQKCLLEALGRPSEAWGGCPQPPHIPEDLLEETDRHFQAHLRDPMRPSSHRAGIRRYSNLQMSSLVQQ